MCLICDNVTTELFQENVIPGTISDFINGTGSTKQKQFIVKKFNGVNDAGEKEAGFPVPCSGHTAGRVSPYFYNLYFAVVVFNGHQPAGLMVIVKEKLFIYNPCLIPLSLFTLWAFLSSFFSPYPREAWLGAPGYLSGFFSYLFFIVLFLLSYSTASRFPGKIDGLINIWLFSASIIAMLGLLEYLGLDILASMCSGNLIFSKGASSSTIQNSNDLGTYMAMAFPFAVLRFMQKASFRTVPLFALIYGCLLTTLCRSAIWALWRVSCLYCSFIL